jgi:tetratricopeptide (TPR) repeat protein
MKTLIRLLVTLVILAGFAPSAGADPEKAKEHFRAGSAAYKEGRYTDAVESFLRAFEEDRQPALIYNTAQAYEKAGDAPNALRSYRRYLRLAPDADDRPTVELRIKNLEARLRDRGVQQVTVFSSPPGASVELDGKPVGKTPWTAEITPGRHVVMLRLSGYPDTAKEFVLAPDRSIELDVTLGGTTSKPADSPAAAADPPELARADSSARVAPWTWAALGIGAAALGTALAFEVSRASAEQDARSANTQIEHQEAFERMESRQTTARIFAGIGAAAAITGGALLYVDLVVKPRSEKSRAKVDLGIGCPGGACGVALRGRLP